MFVFGITCVEPSGLVIRGGGGREKENVVSVLFCGYERMGRDPKLTFLDNSKIFFEILF
jgi:hypothetical protein